MADESIIAPDPDPKGERDEAFADSLGISRSLYIFDIRASIAHALATPADANAVPWRLWGARNIGGRIRSLAQNPRKPEVLYAGSAQGGVFKSADSGDTWLPLGGPQNALPIGALAVTPSDTNILYIGTGEAAVTHHARGSPPSLRAIQRFAHGVGLIRFDERVGVFPAPEVGTGANSFFRIAADPDNADRCWLATPTGLWRREIGPAYSRENMFAPAAAPITPAIGAAVSDVVISPNADGSIRVLAAVMGVGIFRGRFTSAPPPPATVWEPRLEKGLPDPMTPGSLRFDRISLAVCAAQPNHVYAIMEAGADDLEERKIRAVYHSRDGGDSWKERSVGLDLGEQTWVNLVVSVHPENPALVIIGAVDLARSFDYGKSWHTISYWPNFNAQDRAQHGDQHTALFDAVNPHQLWIANDGGISIATDIVQSNPLTDRTWRKRSDGLVASQFNDITVHPQFPFIAGGGLQDNATFVSFGGRSWFPVANADGGEMAFEVRDPRSYIAPNQNRMAVSRVVASNTEDATPDQYPMIFRSPMNADQANFALEMFAVNFDPSGNTTIPAANGKLFIPIVEKHPVIPGHLLIGREGDALFSTNFGTNYLPFNVGISAGEKVSSVAYGGDIGSPPTPLAFWVGTAAGHVWRGLNLSPPVAWTDVTPMTGSPPAPIHGNAVVTRILVHPANPNYVVFSTGRGRRGRVFLSMNQGGTWFEISGLTAGTTVGTPPPVPGGPVPPPGRLPPCPVTSLAFDPSVAPVLPQVLYAGTLAGVFVIRGLPPAAAAAVTAFHPRWATFNGPALSPPGLGQLPLTLVNNLVTVTLPPDPLAPAGSPESTTRHRLIVALYGRGMHACDITPAAASPPYPAGGPAHRFFIRQHLIEDGLTYPRPSAGVMNVPISAGAGYLLPQLNGDPRFPAGTVFFNEVSAWDIRADRAPFQFFEEVVDGVEFDTELVPKDLTAGERNIVYVQVQTAGWGDATGVQVHLFFAEFPPASPLPDTPLPNLQADFWTTFRLMPISPPGAPWSRASTAASVAVHPNDPIVVRFDWLVPKDLGGKVVGLLAICEHPALDPIPAVMPVNLATVIRQERRAAYRRVAVTRFTPDVYLRDSVEDDGTLGAVAFGGRSPDIMVVPARPVDRVAEFADLLDARAGDRLRAGPASNFIYVRVHNRRDVEIRARVELFFIKPASPAVAPFNPANWTAVAPISPPAGVEVTVPPRGSALVEFEWNAAPAPDAPAGVMPSLGLIAFVESAPDAIDPHPIVARVSDVKSFWRFFRALADSNNAAFRMVLYG
jgi:hypothetical protein